MNRLLLITDSFPPAFAPRMGYLCKYLKDVGGWRVTVLHMPPSDNSHSQTFRHLVGFVDEVHEYDGTDGARLLFRAVLMDALRGRTSLARFLLMVWSKCAIRFLGQPTNFIGRRFVDHLLANNQYDVVLASTGGHGNTVAKLAHYASQNAGIPLMLDYRDMFEQYMHSSEAICFRSKLEINERNRLIRQADCVSGVCQEETDILKKINTHSCTIMNGFDPDIFYQTTPIKSDVFRIVYIGSTNTTTYPVELFVEGVKLFVEGQEGAKVKVEFYSTPETYEKGVAHYLDTCTKPYFENLACVEQTMLPSVLSKASVLLVFGHKTVGVPVGVSTKAFEYLAMNRPILDVNLGDRQKLEEMIEEANAGCVAKTAEEINAFLREKYLEWEANRVVLGTTDMEYAKRYSRKAQANEFMTILIDLMHKK